MAKQDLTPASCDPRFVTPASDARYALVLENLGNMKANRPRTVKSLGSSIRSWFKPPLDDKSLAALLEQLTKAGKIKVDGTKVGYSLG